MNLFRSLWLALCVSVPSFLFAQGVPQKMNYQAVARTADGSVIANQEVGLRIAIISSDDMDRPLYAEEHRVITNKLGLMNLAIGGGQVLEGSMQSIDWGSAAHYLQMWLDAEGTGRFVEMGTSQLLTVPYAFYAEHSGSEASGGNRNDPNDWTTSGNAGTLAGTDFIGTTDAQDLVVKTNSTEVARFTTGGDLDMVAGSRILNASAMLLAVDNTSTYVGTATDHLANVGADNMFIGNIAGRDNSTGSENLFIGNRAGRNNTTGQRNIYIGNMTGQTGTTASNNIAIGGQAGQATTTGGFNIYIGRLAGLKNTTGRYNTFIGTEAGEFNLSSDGSSFIGFKAGENSTGANNTAIGNLAGQTNTTGSSNTYIGSNAKGSATITNATAIGANANVTTSNSLVLGNNANVGIGTSAPAYKLDVKGDVSVTGKYVDSSGDAGTAGQIVVSTGTGTNWVDASTLVGATGPSGVVGPTGPAGAQGIQGEDGPTGPSGVIGPTGPAGNDGADGAENAWGLLGNSGTVDGTNFIGTTDDVPVNFKVNNETAGRIDHNLFNTSFGYHAAISMSTGTSNSAVGMQSLVSNTTGSYNTAIGSTAMGLNTEGSSNTASGVQALVLNETGSQNTAVGLNALFDNVTGNYNTALGYSATVGAADLENATAIGANATVDASNKIQLGNANVTEVNTSGTYIGAAFVKNGGASTEYLMADGSVSSGPLVSGTSGQTLRHDGTNWVANSTLLNNGTNVGIGTATPSAKLEVLTNVAGAKAISCENTSVGDTEGYGLRARSVNNPGFGTGVFGEGGWTGVYGKGNGTTGTVSSFGLLGYAEGSAGTRYGVYGYAYGGTTNYGVYCSGNGGYTGTWTLVSDQKFKEDVTPVRSASELIAQLNPVSYLLKRDEFPGMNFPEGRQYGFIAQELEKVIPILVENGSHPGVNQGDANIELKAVNYIGMIPILTKAMQEQQEMIEELKKQNELLLQNQEKQQLEIVKLKKNQR